jgi:hypothetical protein
LRVIEKNVTPSRQKSIFDLLFGRPLSSEEDVKEQVGPAAGIPVFGLDALTSAAYGPEAALTILIPLGLASAAYILPISLTIIVLLSIVYFSYRQTIAAYPRHIPTGAVLIPWPALIWASLLACWPEQRSCSTTFSTVAVGISAG